MDRKTLIQQAQDRLQDRRLVWFGIRGADARALLSIEQFAGAFSFIAPLNALTVPYDVCLEGMTGRRVDLDTYDIEADRSPAIVEFRRQLLNMMREPVAVMSYRPSRFLSNIWFPRSATALNLGMFHETQTPFEYKPWVEQELRRLGVPTLPWEYFADEDEASLREFRAAYGSIVIRASRSDGGARIALVGSEQELTRSAPDHRDGFLSACRYFADNIPLNLNACVHGDGGITTHGLSVQLIGHPELTRRRFGYCGNDFASARDLPSPVIDVFETYARRVGAWLFQHGYRGAFGIDAMVVEGRLYVVEINPRFQGSSWAAAEIDRALDRPDIYLCHLATFLELERPPSPPLRELVAVQKPVTLAVFHNLCNSEVKVDLLRLDNHASNITVDLVPSPRVAIAADAVQFRLLANGGVPEVDPMIRQMANQMRGHPEQGALFGEEV